MDCLILRKDKLRPLQQKHPWIFSGAVQKRPENPQATLVEIRAENNPEALAFGFYEHSAQLLCKIFHFGSLPEGGFSEAYWLGKLLHAKKLRENFIDFSLTDTWRLCHAEADGIPGLVADVYAGNCISFQTTTPATRELLPVWISIFRFMGFTALFHRHGKEEPGNWISAPESNPVKARENGYHFFADPETGQKTGFFIDQRDNRRIISEHSRGRKVLNAFSYSGGFSVFAVAGGAREVVSVDISEQACRLAEENIKLNFPDFRQHSAVATDCFSYLRNMPDDFDLIVLDPPAFAKNRAAVDKAARGYKEINLQAFRKIRPGGILATFSCSQHISAELFRQIIFAAALDSGREVQLIQVLRQPADHPVSIFHPEGDYLKGLLLFVS